MRAKDFKVINSLNEIELIGTKLECISYIRSLGGSDDWNRLYLVSLRYEVYSKHLTNFKIIRRFIRICKFYGYDLHIIEKHVGSCYIGFSYIGKTSLLFIFRFSDHFLSENNQTPAGVICDYTNLSYCINDIKFYHRYYNVMKIDEIDELWTNRYRFY